MGLLDLLWKLMLLPVVLVLLAAVIGLVAGIILAKNRYGRD